MGNPTGRFAFLGELERDGTEQLLAGGALLSRIYNFVLDFSSFLLVVFLDFASFFFDFVRFRLDFPGHS